MPLNDDELQAMTEFAKPPRLAFESFRYLH